VVFDPPIGEMKRQKSHIKMIVAMVEGQRFGKNLFNGGACINILLVTMLKHL